MKVYVVDNGGQWTHREWRVLRYLGVEAEIVPNTVPADKLMDADALVLSGGAPSISYEVPKLGRIGEYLDMLDVPILGICVGAQYMALHYSGKVGPAEMPEYGKTRIIVTEPSPLMEGLPKEFVAWESHNDEIKDPGIMRKFAVSENGIIQGVQHPTKPVFGVQFHPEVEHTEYGEEIFRNFLSLARR